MNGTATQANSASPATSTLCHGKRSTIASPMSMVGAVWRRQHPREPPGDRASLNDERRHHAEHAVLGLDMGEDVAVPHPGAGLIELDEH